MTENPGYAEPQAPSGDSDEPKSAGAPIYTAKVENLGGTSGEVRVEGGKTLATAPTSHTDQGSNPEQFLAMAWSTCLGETLKVVLAANGVEALSRVRVEVDLHGERSSGFYFVPRAYLSIDGVSSEDAEKFAARAHARCPISKLLKGQGTPSIEIEEYKNPDNFQLS
ncbi:OsmC family protein [Brevibacterium sp. ZH18]|uniref:OsmC family protein n=1 Tax=Brevibacterium sp. ZH18 TaxID=2927784 RepID=UPI001F60AE5E|nr:OsmC family protein [Brevibacterium sp. ZH18]MCI4011359.1 OsmC family protein [Brevibacterium sp. ZH18]